MDYIDIEKIDGHICENITELKESILKHGLLCPLCLLRSGERYKILSGNRRYSACLELGYKRLPAVIQQVVGESESKKEPPRKKTKRRKPVRKFFPKSIGFFTNTIDRAVLTLKEAGVDAVCEKKQEGDCIEYNIKIPIKTPKN